MPCDTKTAAGIYQCDIRVSPMTRPLGNWHFSAIVTRAFVRRRDGTQRELPRPRLLSAFGATETEAHDVACQQFKAWARSQPSLSPRP
jgi:hypothetical protein